SQPWLSGFSCSSRRRHTRSKRDWSSDVCSSDLTWHFHHTKTGILLRYLIVHFIYHKVQCHLHHLNGHPFTCTAMPCKIISATLRNEIERTAFPFHKSLRIKYSRIIPNLRIMVCPI